MDTDTYLDILARAAWTRIAEPGDLQARILITGHGPYNALALVKDETFQADDTFQAHDNNNMAAGLQRWRSRLGNLNPERDIDTIERLGGRFITPDSWEWPTDVDVLDNPPIGLWLRGEATIPALHANVAIIGSRDSTSYGNQVTAEMSAALARNGYTIVSGGAYGIDAQAHRAALAATDEDRPTLAVLAGGLDRYYPAGNDELLRTIERRGVLVSELPPGMAPTRWRFLNRNRIIAALSAVTVVVEARWRSGSMSTVDHALKIGRQVGAVPGSVFSSNSSGTHKILKEGKATLVTDAHDVNAMVYGAPATLAN
jgi:DNA processing protein